MMSQSVSEQDQEAAVASPGRRLREAREALGLSREDVAAQLRLEVRLVTALEEDDQAALPPSAFVTGYLRSYARLVRIEPDQVLAAYGGGHEQPDLLPNIRVKRQASGGDLAVRLVTYALVIGLAVLVAMRWIDFDTEVAGSAPASGAAADGETAVTAAPSERAGEEAQEASSPVPAEPAPRATAPAPEPAPVEEAPVAQAPRAAPAATLPEGTAQPAPASAALSLDEPEAERADLRTPEPEPEPEPLSAPDPEPAAVPAPAVAAAPAPDTVGAPGQDEDRLVLTFEAPSWTEVRDADNQRIAFGLMKPGQRLDVSGQAPFSVLLGYAPGVRVEYNGQSFDHGPYTRNDVARFVLGEDEPSP